MFSLQYNLPLPTKPCTKEDFYKVVSSDRVKNKITEFRKLKAEGNDKEADAKKRSLPIFIYQATFEETESKNGSKACWRKQEAAHLNGLVMLDIDHIDNPAKLFMHMPPDLFEEGAKNQVMLVHITPSGKGLRVVFKADIAIGDLSANQHHLATLLGVEPDEACKDASRASFSPQQEEILYINDAIFDYQDDEFEKLFGERYRKGMKTLSNSPCLGGEQGLRTDGLKPLPLTGEDGRGLYKGIPYSDIINEYWRRTGGVPVDGERNVRLHKLAVNLRAIMENKPQRILEVLPRLGLSEGEVLRVAESACKEEPKDFTYLLKGIVKDLMEERNMVDDEPETPPEMPKKLPKLIQLLISRTPDVYKPAVAHAVFPSLAAHLYKVRFRYIDNVLHEATLMNVLMAGTGAGKDCISQPINYIMADIRKRDEENLQREKQWKQEVSSKGANKDKRQRPEGLIIQEVDPDMTNPAFVMRMAEADGHFLYTKMNEIDQFDALRGSGKGGQQFQIMCLAFDPGNRYGQTRVGTGSVTEKVCIRFNWNAATTITKGQRYFRNVLTDGPISRINFCTIPEREIGAEMPVYGTYDAAFEEELRPYIEKLTKAVGEVNCPQAFKLAQKMVEENAEFARLSQSRVYENLSFRANVIAWLKGCLLYVANDCKWDKSIEDFVRWSLQYDMWCKMQFFAEAIEQADYIDDSKPRRGPRNLLELLPDEFSLQDAINIRRQQGLDGKGARKMINQWAHRGYILCGDGDGYSKVKFKNIKNR
ncbi:MAG: VirE protein [Prevotella sp.]|nr:VirE protein [Prevotella sp.]